MLLPGLGVGLKMQQRPEQVTDPSDPARCGQKQTVCTAVLCAGLRQLFLRLLPRALQVPGILGGSSAPCPDHTNSPGGHLGPYHVAGPSLRLGPSKARSPCSFSFLELSRGLASLPAFLGLQPPFQIHVKAIIFLACMHPDTHHSSPPSPPSRGSENPASSSLKASDRTAPLRHFVKAMAAAEEEAAEAAELRGPAWVL